MQCGALHVYDAYLGQVLCGSRIGNPLSVRHEFYVNEGLWACRNAPPKLLFYNEKKPISQDLLNENHKKNLFTTVSLNFDLVSRRPKWQQFTSPLCTRQRDLTFMSNFEKFTSIIMSL